MMILLKKFHPIIFIFSLSLIFIHGNVVVHYPSRLLSYWSPSLIALSSQGIYLSTIDLPINQSRSYSPMQLTIDSNDYLYVATGDSNSFAFIYKYRITDDQLIERISLPIYVPAALTISPITGDIYVATTDINNPSVYVFNKTGRQINHFNASNFSPPLTEPTALTRDKTDQRLYVANRDDSSTGRIFLINPQTGQQLQVYRNSEIYRPSSLIVDVDRNIYVADMATNCIVALTSNGTLIRTYTDSLYNPQGLTFTINGNLLLSNTLNNRMVLFDIVTAQVLKVYSSNDPTLISPRLLLLLNNEEIYINSLTNDIKYNIFKKLTMNNSSANVTQIIDPTPHFAFPVCLAKDINGQIYLTDDDIPYGYIHIFASNGTQIGTISTNNPQMRNPHGIDIDLQNNIYVADTGNVRLVKLLTNGTIVQTYKTTPSLSYPYHVKVRDDGVIYISDAQCSWIYQLTNDGKQQSISYSFSIEEFF